MKAYSVICSKCGNKNIIEDDYLNNLYGFFCAYCKNKLDLSMD